MVRDLHAAVGEHQPEIATAGRAALSPAEMLLMRTAALAWFFERRRLGLCWVNGISTEVQAQGGDVIRLPSHFIIATEDHMVPPTAQHAMSRRAGGRTQELRSSHAMMMSHPD